MNSKKCLLAAIAVTVVYFLLGGFFYAWLMKDWFAANGGMGSGDPNMGFIAAATLFYGLLMSYTFPIGYKGGPAVKEGIRFGIVFALIVNGPSTLFMMAMGQCTVAAMMVSWIWEVFCGAVLGVITAKIYGGNK